MSVAIQILDYSQKHDINLWAEGEYLRLDAPETVITPQFLNTLKRYKPELLDILHHRTLTNDEKADIQEHLEERAAIMEHDGGLSGPEAEWEARSNLRVYKYRLSDDPVSWLMYLCPGSDLAQATQQLKRRFGPERVLEVCNHKNK